MIATMNRGSAGCQHVAGRVLARCLGALALSAAGLLAACGGSDVAPTRRATMWLRGTAKASCTATR